MNRTVVLSVFALSVVSRSLWAQDPRSDEVLKWNEIAVNAIRHDNTPPPMAARNLAVVHGAIYDSVNAILRTHTVYRVPVRPAARASVEAAAAAAAHRTLSRIYPAQRQRFDQSLRESIGQIPDRRSASDGVNLGIFVADRYIEWRQPDLAILSKVSSGSPAVDSSLWQPTPPQFHKPVLPEWGKLTPFAVQDMKQFQSKAPPSLTSKDYAQCFNEVKELGRIDSKVRTDDETEIAFFWADGAHTSTPPGHWNELARAVAFSEGNRIGENARLFALLNISMADAAICCWECKFSFQYWRPITGIRNANADGNPATQMDADWTPLLETPPFPAYTSGHSSFSGAAAATLAEFFGTDNIPFEATSDGVPGVVRHFDSFSQAADEAGRSRIYGGIHWECDNIEGLTTGRSLGTYVSRSMLQDVRHARNPELPEQRTTATALSRSVSLEPRDQRSPGSLIRLVLPLRQD